METAEAVIADSEVYELLMEQPEGIARITPGAGIITAIVAGCN
jgi:hypothetical protein